MSLKTVIIAIFATAGFIGVSCENICLTVYAMGLLVAYVLAWGFKEIE